MDREKAVNCLLSDDPHSRLIAARYFTKFAIPSDSDALRLALRKEQVSWIKAALEKAIETSLSGDITTATQYETPEEDEPNFHDKELYAQATEEISNSLVHELRPILGVAQYYAKKELADKYETSRTKQELNRISQLLSAIDKLGRAASPPVLEEFDLAKLISTVAENEGLEREIRIEKAGPSPLLVIGDVSLIDMATRNGLRNAIEASESLQGARVVINWGKTDKDYWIAILDNGLGLPAGSDKAFDIGSTSKEGHVGMGLALAKTAVFSLRGTIRLSPRKGGGAVYEFRWPLSGRHQ